MAEESDVVVWEWFTDHGRWRPYQPNIARGIEENYGRTLMLRLGDIDPSMAVYEIDFNTRQQKRLNTGTVRSIRRRTFQATSAPGKNIEWQWQDDYNWCPYDVDTSCIIEEAYQHPYGSIDLSTTPSCLPYELDLVAMTQQRSGTGFVRNIRRMCLPVPGYPRITPAQCSSSASMESVEEDSHDGGSAALSRPTSLQAPPQPSSQPTATTAAPDDSNSSQGSDCSTSASSSLGRAGKKHPGKRAASRKSVAATSGVRATVAWTSPPDPNAAGTSSGSGGIGTRSSLPRSVSVPATMAGVSGSANERPSVSSGAVISSSSTTSCLAAAAAAGRMTRSQSTPNSIIARPAHAAGARLSPVMTVPVKLHPTPIPIFSPPPISKGSIRPVEGIKPSKKKQKTTSLIRVDSPEDVMKKYVNKVKKIPDEECPICYEKLSEGSHYTEDTDDVVLKLSRCGHLFHRGCLHAMYNSGPKDGSIQCPTCKTIYGVKHGNQPSGRMDYHIIPPSLQGFPDCGTIRIIYDIPPGTQGPEHPHPGKRYSARGFPRHCYLPDNEIGRKILKLLIIAWERRLLFTIGTSATTGEPCTVVWNEIHHKTEFGSNVTGHGYPDPNYFDNVLSELAAQGVTEDCLKD
ncbi:E3 ubiquitin-protein ligase DTX4-like isoform X2 [Acanthaster planci]|uniref:E3 ubiquitin-protein ligase n=1 Tax=Acanthaster planci TaxID=133434 RepID=A0A8B7XZ40_ACAPL|nr:E3 ubiquitin-protein ligase DTX4-like isoform X2 [Acanthaster planci]